ncbi:M48 family metallopeptidase [Rhodoferax sp. UBA5149]|uniref:M48 family metallopeptidase n=1 Tax=Rhodoferax sp. UBA5149 TaxID=1947379 RepID=UPI0025E2FC6A|nr:SprT family zinc-dependent metalloprotease [Rhodoferax sp. UBA5149]
MHPLLRFTLDLFESNQAPAPVNNAQPAIELIAAGAGEPASRLQDLIAPATFRHPRANREARLADALVAYEFKRGKRRTIGFSVGPQGLVVRAPKWVPLYEVDAALQEKSMWIIRKLGETAERHERLVSQRIEWRDGTTIPFLGQPVTVVLDPRHGFGAAGAELQTGTPGLTLQVALPHAATAEQIRDAVQAWLMRQAKRVFIERLDHFAPQLQVQWRKLSLSNAATRWGSARVDGAIRLNWRLIHFRQPVIDYVVAHELSHLRVMDHSPRFWDTVRSVVPDYAALRGQLKDEAAPRWQ